MRRVGAERTSVRQQWLGNQVSQSGERGEGRGGWARFPFTHSQSFKALSSANSPWTLLQSGSQRDWSTSMSPLFHRPATALLPLSVWGPPWESCTTSGALTHKIPAFLVSITLFLCEGNMNIVVRLSVSVPLWPSAVLKWCFSVSYYGLWF